MTQLMSPMLLRNRWCELASDYYSGDIDTDVKLARLQAGLNAAVGRTFLFNVPFGASSQNYRITSRTASAVSGMLVHPSGVKIEGDDGAALDMSAIGNSGSPRYLLRADGTAGTAVNLTANVARGATEIEVGAPGMGTLGLVRGDRITITSNKLFIAGGTVGAEEQGEITTVTTVAADRFTVEPPLFDSYATADVARVQKLAMHKGSLRNLTLRGPGQFTTDTVGDRGLHYIWSDGLVIEDVEADWLDNGNYLYSCPDLSVSRMRWRFDEQNARLANQYGLALVNACQDALVDHCGGINGKHGIVQTESSLAPGVTRRVHVRKASVQGTWNYGVSAHTNAEDWTVCQSEIANCNAGIEAGCRKFYSEFNNIQLLPNADIGVGIGISDICEEVYSSNDRVSGGRFAFRLDGVIDIIGPDFTNPGLFVGSTGPREIHITDLFAEGFTADGISLAADPAKPGANVAIRNFVTRNAGATAFAPQAIDIAGPWTNVIIDGGDFHGAGSGATGCILTGADVSGEFRGRQAFSGTFTGPVVSGAMKRGAVAGYGASNLTWTAIAAGAAATRTMNVVGAVVGAPVTLGAADALDTGLSMSAHVSALGVATVKIANHSGGSITPFGGGATAFTVIAAGAFG